MTTAAKTNRMVLLVTLGLFGLVFGLRFAADAPRDGLTFLYVVPIILLAVEFGVGAGVAAGVAALGLFAIWVLLTAPEVSTISVSLARHGIRGGWCAHRQDVRPSAGRG